jgi:hypothetical protein
MKMANPKRAKNLKKNWGIFFHEFRGETFLYEEIGKTPISKTQQVLYVESVFDELEIVIKITTTYKTSHG